MAEEATQDVATHEVVGGAVVLRTKAGSSAYIYKGGVFNADLFTEASVEHAISVGLVAEIARSAEVVEIEGPDESWTHERIDAFAEEWGIEIPSDGKKDEKLAAIAAEIEKRTAEAEAGALS
ncbi:hypothetical protein [Microbacterium testaceum]|uniref:hypothetical protein n=1 Tax=Microbacterium testaceum TaxID=2033 RepID=UPI001D17B4CC|nr:hypothetical protein [Microbacterium testaceum]MCC4250780.1 hypothetical protein [Microbacterium testaceum]